jgi:Cu+-exporting ATPase
MSSVVDDERTSHDLVVHGMTCASCAARVERRLNSIDGVTATVNYATERAHVAAVAGIDVDELIEAVEAAGYGAEVAADGRPEHHDPSVPGADPAAEWRRRLAICTALSVPVVAMAMIPALQFDYWQWLSLTLAAPVVVWGAWPFHRAAWINLRHGATTMDTLISIGVLAAFTWSLYALFFGGAGEPGMTHGFDLTLDRSSPGAAHPGAAHRGSSASQQIYLEVAAGVTTFIVAGRYLEARAKRQSGAALAALLDLGATTVHVQRDGREITVPIDELAVGDLFVVRPGETIAADGTVEAGASSVDASLVTGEPVPVDIDVGDAVTGGTLNVDGRLVVRATRVGADTKLSQIARLVEQAQTGKAPVQRLADRVSSVFVPVVLVLSAGTLAYWLARGEGAAFAFSAAVAVLIIACPCALGLATPTAIMVGTGRGAQLGIIIKGPEILESTRTIDTIVLDKTGTVTEGAMRLVDVVPAPGVDRDQLLRTAASLEAASEHPIARAIVAAASDRGFELADVDGFENTRGIGVQGTVDGRVVAVGRPSDETLPAESREGRDAAEQAGHTVIAVSWDGAFAGLLAVADTVRPTSADAIGQLRQLGLRPYLLTGDNPRAAANVAAAVDIEPSNVIADVLPDGKVDVVRRLQEEGHVVAMVGDGVNDAAALAQADLGIAMGTGTDAAIEASDLTLVAGDLGGAGDAIRLSRRTLTIIKGNLFWAFAYNVAALPIAAAGLLNPMLAGAAMAFSSVFVVTNSLRLRRFDARRTGSDREPRTPRLRGATA